MRLLTLFPTFALSAFGAAIVTGEYAPTTNTAHQQCDPDNIKCARARHTHHQRAEHLYWNQRQRYLVALRAGLRA